MNNEIINLRNDKLGLIKNDIENTKSIINDNIEKTIQKNDKLELLLEKSDDLTKNSFIFRRRSYKYKIKQCFSMYKKYFIYFVLFLLFLYIFLSILCGYNLKC